MLLGPWGITGKRYTFLEALRVTFVVVLVVLVELVVLGFELDEVVVFVDEEVAARLYLWALKLKAAFEVVASKAKITEVRYFISKIYLIILFEILLSY